MKKNLSLQEFSYIYYHTIKGLCSNNTNLTSNDVRKGENKMSKKLHPQVIKTASWIQKLIQDEKNTTEILKSIRKNGIKRNFFTEKERNLVSVITETLKQRIDKWR